VTVPSLTILERLEAERLTEDNGFGLPQEEVDGWLTFTGLACPQRLWITRHDERWLIGLAHGGVMTEVAADTPSAPLARPDGGPAVVVDALGPIIRRLFRLARSLPTAPLDSFVVRAGALPRSTEAERLVVQRIGQDIFRTALLDYWGGVCPLTGISHPRLLRASHMQPWANCTTDAERLDVHNGLLLAAHLDAAFDAGLISFTDAGAMLVSPALPPADRSRLGLDTLPSLTGLKPAHLRYLVIHQATVFKASAGPGAFGLSGNLSVASPACTSVP
jgi:hypothetical protein